MNVCWKPSIYSLCRRHVRPISHKGQKKYPKTLWSPAYLFDRSCHPYWNDQRYGHRLLHLCTMKLYSKTWEVKTIHCDNGSNFVGAKRELAK